MKRFGSTTLVATALLAWPPARADIRGIATPEEGWAAIEECAAIANDAARHACLDGVLRKANIGPTSEAQSEEHRKRFGLQRPVAAAPAAPVAPAAPTTPQGPMPVPQVAVASTASAAAGSEKAAPQKVSKDQLQVTLSKVGQTPDGKLQLTTAEGAVWKQVESDPVRPEPVVGQTMTIRKVSLGGFLCAPSKYVSFRCIRSQ